MFWYTRQLYTSLITHANEIILAALVFPFLSDHSYLIALKAMKATR